MSHSIKPGVATGDQVQAIFKYAKEKGFAMPAVNVTSTSTVNGVMETAARLKAPVIIQFSNGGAIILLVRAYLIRMKKQRFWEGFLARNTFML